jgi:hypothetical protein
MTSSAHVLAVSDMELSVTTIAVTVVSFGDSGDRCGPDVIAS